MSGYEIPILPLVEHYGGKVYQQKFLGWSRASCPLPDHDDQHASAQVSEEKQRVRCLACAYNYDAIALVQAAEGLKFKEALTRARELAGLSDGDLPRSTPRREGSLLPGLPARKGDRPARRAYVPPWAKRG